MTDRAVRESIAGGDGAGVWKAELDDAAFDRLSTRAEAISRTAGETLFCEGDAPGGGCRALRRGGFVSVGRG